MTHRRHGLQKELGVEVQSASSMIIVHIYDLLDHLLRPGKRLSTWAGTTNT